MSNRESASLDRHLRAREERWRRGEPVPTNLSNAAIAKHFGIEPSDVEARARVKGIA